METGAYRRNPDGQRDTAPLAHNVELGLLLMVQGLEQVRQGMWVIGQHLQPIERLERRVRQEERPRPDAA